KNDENRLARHCCFIQLNGKGNILVQQLVLTISSHLINSVFDSVVRGWEGFHFIHHLWATQSLYNFQAGGFD
ncbi:hypothetical protein DVA81_19445, partial [Acinetobacter baumannii]